MLKKRFIAVTLSVLALCAALLPFKNARAENEVSISAQSAVMLECSTNTVLYSKAAHEKLPMASTTKVMTALVAIENGNLDEIVTTADEAYGVEGSSIYISKNEKLSLRDLLYGLMLRSGNDAAVAIAIHIGGSVDGFVAMMNKRAKELGAVNTHFANPNGLPNDSHYTTAYDLGLICSAALKNEAFKTIVSTQYHTATTGSVKRSMMNKNKLLWQYDGAIGIKTGYTEKAGKCLTFAAERDGMMIVGVVLNCPDMFPDSMELMDYCFREYEMYTVVRKGAVIIRSQIDYAGALATFVAASDINVPVKKSEGIKLTTNIKLNNKLSAPMYCGDRAGVLELYSGTRLIAQTGLVCSYDVAPSSIMHFFNRVIMQFAS